MTIKGACRIILGRKAADKIIDRDGIRWAALTAMLFARESDDPEAIEVIRRYNDLLDNQ